MRAFPVSFLAVAVIIAGCVDPGPAKEVAITSDTPSDMDVGSIQGTVTNEELIPIQGALIAIEEATRTATTDESGIFLLEGISPGTHRLIVQAIGHQSIAANVDVAVGEVKEVRYTLAALEIIEPYSELLILAGFTECVASAVFFTYYVELPACSEQKHVLQTDVNVTWRYSVLELVWDGESSMHFVSDTDTNCGYGNESTNSCFYWKIGRSPMRLDAKPNDPDPKYVQWKMLYPEAFHWVMTGLDAGFLQNEIDNSPACDLAYQTYAGYSADCGGIGAGYPGYRFDLYATIFHHDVPADVDTYSALPEA